jgi:hypothetical protein
MSDTDRWPGYTPEAQAYEIATRPAPEPDPESRLSLAVACILFIIILAAVVSLPLTGGPK